MASVSGAPNQAGVLIVTRAPVQSAALVAAHSIGFLVDRFADAFDEIDKPGRIELGR
jgi:hypothetical protein